MIKSNDFGFNHVFVNSSFTNNSNNKKEYDDSNKKLTFVLLHGTGGDVEDLKFRTLELADFIQNCSLHYKFDLKQTIAVGFSNGANIASSILLLRPDVFQGAILFRAMVPLVPDDPLPNLSSKKILLS